VSKGSDALETLIDVRNRIADDPSAQVRTEAAERIANEYSNGALSWHEREIAAAILVKLAMDVEQGVRAALATHVLSCSFLPPSLSRAISDDVEAISVPFIRYSPALTDEDLLRVIEGGNSTKQVAIAGRDAVSEQVSEALVAADDGDVITILLANEHAAVSERSLHKIIDRFGSREQIQSLIVERPCLPLTVTERIIQSVSNALRERLIEKHALPRELAEELAVQAKEGALIKSVNAFPGSIIEASDLAARLYARGRLTPTLMMRALCAGDSAFFEAAMALMAETPLENAVILIHDSGPLGFKAIYEKAQLPLALLRPFRAAVKAQHEITAGLFGAWTLDHAEMVLRRVAEECEDACPGDLEHFLSQISHGMIGRREPGHRAAGA
jgi:uncharacterized protein (DUF2336 family)